jgi:hypothetical protein
MWKVTNVKAQTTMKAKGVLANARSEVPSSLTSRCTGDAQTGRLIAIANLVA